MSSMGDLEKSPPNHMRQRAQSLPETTGVRVRPETPQECESGSAVSQLTSFPSTSLEVPLAGRGWPSNPNE